MSIDDDDLAMFRDAVQGAKELKQDTIITPRHQKTPTSQVKLKEANERDQGFYFSDEFVPLLKEEGPTQYARADVSKYEVKRLRRGVYVPDISLDLHGMTQKQAKRELAALIALCKKEGICCACVMHGIGKHVLKTKTPLWLAQHPDVLAFHQAPMEFGGAGALLVLLEIPNR